MATRVSSIQFRLLRAITITIISIIGVICAIVGYELYKRNTVQFNEFTAQQFFNIEKSIKLLIQKGLLRILPYWVLMKPFTIIRQTRKNRE